MTKFQRRTTYAIGHAIAGVVWTIGLVAAPLVGAVDATLEHIRGARSGIRGLNNTIREACDEQDEQELLQINPQEKLA